MPDKAARKPPVWVRATVLLLCGASLVFLLVSFDGMGMTTLVLLKVLAFVVFLFVISTYVYFRHGRLLQQTSRAPHVIGLPAEQAFKLQKSAVSDTDVSLAQAKLFASTIIAPAIAGCESSKSTNRANGP
ncbi:hypothetical protein Ade02nite_96930 [Paractinoplanes deccanensis]|uniref:Uncharacterized protein n=1 Tax=Paractinoplanes deccanensis TaxID=113561 RepID=A0ABQ3YM62_9ACTN|nr:hypothetical protein [Actinoplanes deccanensis]GID81052.1 hypothetical protein Ade02nite_96930 [Actinoplanes deccanensis]